MMYFENRGNCETDFAGMEVQDLRALVLNDEESLQKRDEAIYYLLNEKLAQSLARKFEPYRNRLEDSFEDVLMDFFLYLRDDDEAPYKKLLRIRSDASFEGWMVISFRNFAGKKAATARRFPRASSRMDCFEQQDIEPIPQDRLVGMLSTLVAYCCQEFRPVSRFIFLRMLLTLLDKRCALPDKEVAVSLGITDVYYRVISCRLRSKVRMVKEMLLKGSQLTLNEDSKRLADELNDDFSSWRHIIAGCYETTLTSLPQSGAIAALRANHASQSESLLYDNAPAQYGNVLSPIRALWNVIDDFRILREPLA